MGMAASQARLLSITARLSNNENTGQSISYAKQRLADQSHQITEEYNKALDATKLTVLTGFNGAEANYEDISYNRMTCLQMAETTKQYVVTDTKGRVLVTEQIADAYTMSKGDYNKFLAQLGYSQADIYAQNTSGYTDKEKRAARVQIHEAWDKYFETVGIEVGEPEHDTFTEEEYTKDNDIEKYKWSNTYASVIMEGNLEYIDQNGNKIDASDISSRGYSFVGDGYASCKMVQKDENGDIVYKKNENGDFIDKDGNVTTDDSKKVPEYVWKPLSYDGTTKESKDLFDYAMALTEAYYRTESPINGVPGDIFDLEAYKTATESNNLSALKYYKNLFNRIQQNGMFTYTDTPLKAKQFEGYKYGQTATGTGKVAKNPLKDNYTFEAALRDGSLRLEYYSTTEKKFKSTTISEDNCIQEVPDERAIAKAESKYTQDMADLEHKDKQFDLELRKLDTEHNALQTEYESVKNVVDKNVESTFKIFS